MRIRVRPAPSSELKKGTRCNSPQLLLSRIYFDRIEIGRMDATERKSVKELITHCPNGEGGDRNPALGHYPCTRMPSMSGRGGRVRKLESDRRISERRKRRRRRCIFNLRFSSEVNRSRRRLIPISDPEERGRFSVGRGREGVRGLIYISFVALIAPRAEYRTNRRFANLFYSCVRSRARSLHRSSVRAETSSHCIS